MSRERRVPRLEDLPYWTSPPIQYVYQQTAPLAVGLYTFANTRAAMTPAIDLSDQTLLYIRQMSFGCDIPELDYQQALNGASSIVPTFNIFFQSDANSPRFRNPVNLVTYFEQIDYKLVLEPKQVPNALSGVINGVLTQTAALAGIANITATIEIYVQEISDDNFVANFKKNYPGECE